MLNLLKTIVIGSSVFCATIVCAQDYEFAVEYPGAAADDSVNYIVYLQESGSNLPLGKVELTPFQDQQVLKFNSAADFPAVHITQIQVVDNVTNVVKHDIQLHSSAPGKGNNACDFPIATRKGLANDQWAIPVINIDVSDDWETGKLKDFSCTQTKMVWINKN